MEPAAAPADDELAPNGWSWAILRGFRAGDGAALREVYRRHADDVARLLRLGFSFESAGRSHRFAGYAGAFELQDAMQETFRLAFEPRARQAYDGVRPYAPYLRTIARNVVLKRFRAQREVFPIAEEPGEGDARVLADDDETASPEVAIASDEIRELVAAFLRALDPGDRELLTLRFVEGHSQRDVAEMLKIGRQQIRTREAKLRARLLAFVRPSVLADLGLARDDAAASMAVLLPLPPALVQALVEALR